MIPMKRTSGQLAIADVFLSAPHAPLWGYSILQKADVTSGVLYPTLRKWTAAGLLRGDWENPDDILGRSPRRYYKLTDAGRTALTELLAPAA